MDEQGLWTLSPAYDMTYIFNTGGFLPETNHCLMIRGKLTGVSLEDVLELAKENGIRPAEKIIHEVATAIQDFRKIASRYEVSERWIAAVEDTLCQNLKSWGLLENDADATAWSVNGSLTFGLTS